jgi:hypothetical protein
VTVETDNFYGRLQVAGFLVLHNIRLHWQRYIFLWAKAGMWDERFSLPLTILWAKAGMWYVREIQPAVAFDKMQCPDCSPGVRNLRARTVDGQMVLCWCSGYGRIRGACARSRHLCAAVLGPVGGKQRLRCWYLQCRATCTIDTWACTHILSSPACTVNCCVLCRQLLPTFLCTDKSVNWSSQQAYLMLHGSIFQPCQISATMYGHMVSTIDRSQELAE